ncbi:unnamed protein product [Meganyctiphanes norvegica]|uniref:Uncharacterized protein n=1 Tax=Meganyctiphanes norvegica TaxID=48144 RepID=A0AAV2RG26_MEGNR
MRQKRQQWRRLALPLLLACCCQCRHYLPKLTPPHPPPMRCLTLLLVSWLQIHLIGILVFALVLGLVLSMFGEGVVGVLASEWGQVSPSENQILRVLGTRRSAQKEWVHQGPWVFAAAGWLPQTRGSVQYDKLPLGA